ncbi:LacI family DNA-binding transcriptional regulator [Nonomuraea insulae]|uniref:LacI family DNA-binding transcriptional regulator n=1 Tax=Nonomuraea insulae TaxID=1616787 RepID=A0ABW1DFX3_9ACTN
MAKEPTGSAAEHVTQEPTGSAVGQVVQGAAGSAAEHVARKRAGRVARMRDVAEVAGVSTKTVSEVVNGIGQVRESTRLRVKAAIEELGYRANPAARRLNSESTGVLTLALPRLASGWHAALAAAVIELAESGGTVVALEPTGGDRERELEILRNDSGVADGAILAPLALDNQPTSTPPATTATPATPGTATPGTATPGTATPGTATPGTAGTAATPGTAGTAATPGTAGAMAGTVAGAAGEAGAVAGAPVVLIGTRRLRLPFDQVVADRAAMVEAAVALLRSHGRERIAILGTEELPHLPPTDPGPGPIANSTNRLSPADPGLRVAANSTNRLSPADPGPGPIVNSTNRLQPAEPGLWVVAESATRAAGYAAVDRLVAGGTPFDGLVALDDALAFGALHALRDRALAVPADVEVIGVGGAAESAYSWPSLSTVEADVRDMARQAHAWLLDRIAGDTGPPRHYDVPFTVVERESTR